MRVFDCFPFFNELEILELRLTELDDVVDFFVISEASTSHNGTPKDFIFEKNKDRYSKWLDKIIYVMVEDMPQYDQKDVFKLEYFQRNALSRGLKKALPGDKIILSDCDEIPNVDGIRFNLSNRVWVTFSQELFYYYVNNRVHRAWCGPVMAEFGSFKEPQDLRRHAIRRQFKRSGENIVEKGGWHYSYMTGGDAKRVKDKVALFAERHLSNEAGSPEDIQEKMKKHLDLFNRTENKPYYSQSIIDISNNKPRMLDKFLEKYPSFIYKEEHA